jgi:hypothetical protein
MLEDEFWELESGLLVLIGVVSKLAHHQSVEGEELLNNNSLSEIEALNILLSNKEAGDREDSVEVGVLLVLGVDD